MNISFKEKLLFCIIVILAGSFIFMGKYYDNFVQPLIAVSCIVSEEGDGEDGRIVVDFEVRVEKPILLSQNIEITHDSITNETMNVEGIQRISGSGFTGETIVQRKGYYMLEGTDKNILIEVIGKLKTTVEWENSKGEKIKRIYYLRDYVEVK